MRAQNYKVCTVCGKRFPCPQSNKTVTCSKECSSIHRSRKHVGLHNQWSEASREKLRAIGQTANLKLGTPAAMQSPIAGAFETNQNAKRWVLKSPDGVLYDVENLALFIRQHPEWFDNPVSARTALCTAASCMSEETTPPSRKGKEFSQYKGWQVLSRKGKEKGK